MSAGNDGMMVEANRIASEAWSRTAPTRTLTDEEAFIDIRERLLDLQARFTTGDAGYYAAAAMLLSANMALRHAACLRRPAD